MRCTLAPIAVAFLQDMIDRIGVGPTFTFFGCLCSLSGVLFVIERRWGMKGRLQRPDDDDDDFHFKDLSLLEIVIQISPHDFTVAVN